MNVRNHTAEVARVAHDCVKGKSIMAANLLPVWKRYFLVHKASGLGIAGVFAKE